MSDQGGSSFETVPVAPGGGRRPLAVAILVLVVVVGSIAIARLSPDTKPAAASETVAPSGPVATVQPTSSLAQTEPTATPLPALEWFSALTAPVGNLLVSDATIHWLRQTGVQPTSDALARPGQDLLLQNAHGDTVCLCWGPSGTESGDARPLDLVRRWSDLSHLTSTTVTMVDGMDPSAPSNGPTQVDLEPSPDGRTVYLARAVRSATAWQVSVDSIDLRSASIVDTVDLISIPQDDASEVLTVDRPTLRIAPDGRHAIVLSAVTRPTALGPVATARHAWMIGLDGDSFGTATSVDRIADAGADGPSEGCAWIAFVTPAIVAKGCTYPTDALETAFQIRRYDLLGRALGDPVSASPGSGADEPLLDTQLGVAYAWDPVGHHLLAEDLVNGTERGIGASSDPGLDPGAVVLEGARPLAGPRTTWSDGRSATDAPVPRALVGSPDGRLLFAIGDGPAPDSSSGIWVYDTNTLRLLERWPALSSYDAVTLFDGGQWLAAIGRAGVTANGGPADWGTSLTIHEVATGRPFMRLGDLQTSETVTFPFERPLAVP